MKSMKRNFWKKTAAGIMAVMILSGGVPILDMPSMSMFDMTASAASTQYISLDTTARYKVTVEWNVENDNDNGDNYFELTYRNYTDRSLELNEMNNVYGYAASVIQSNAAQKTGSQSATFILPSPPTAIRYSCYGKTADKSEWYINRIKVEVVNDYYAADSGKPRSIDLWKGSFGMNMSHVGGRSNAATLSFSGSEPTFSKWDNDNGSDKTQFTLNYFKDGFFPSINGVEEIFGSNTINFSGFSSQADGVTYSYYPGCPYDQFGAKWPTGKAFLTSFSSRGGWSYNEMFQAGHLVLRDTNYSYTPYTITITFRYNNNLSKSKTVNIIPPYYNLTVGNSSHGTLTVNPTGSVAARTPVQVTAKATDIGYIPYRMEYNATPTSCSFWYFNKHENGVWQGTNNMPNYDVNNLYATFKDVWGVGQGANGSKDHPYLISSTEGWDLLCDSLEDADLYNGVKGKYFQLTKDITVNRMVGSDSHPFEGTFDGNGKTLTFSCTPTDNYAAPFRKLKGTESAHAKISNLTVKTTITAKDYRHIAGLVALHEGYLDITNCNANVTLKASVGNNNPADLYPAGLVSQSNGNLTISGCKVTGNIETNGKYAGGFVGIAQDAMTIENSMSSVTINSTVSGDGTHGGFVGVVQTKSVLTINGCVFNGRLLGADTNSCGGFIGWRNSGAEICNSLFAPAEVTVKKDGSATFSRNTVDTYNCYYTYLFNDGTNHVSGSANDATKPDRWYNGKQAHTVTAGENVTINYGTAKNTYSVSGITAYDTGLLYGGKLYAGKNEQVYLTLSYTGTSPAGYNPSGYSVSLSNGKMTMPDNDVIVNAVYKANTYSVVFNKNASDATGTMAAQSFTYDAEKALTANAFKRTGWTFAGWATSANGDVVYTDKQSIKNLTAENGKTVTLYAKWTQNDYTISKSAEHGTIKVKVNNAETNTAHYSDTVKVEVTPDTGYYVKSVKYNNKSVTLQNNAGSFTMPAENVTVNAEMAKRNYDVSYDSGIQHGTVTADKTNADYGEKVSVTVEPDTGYSIKNVTMNGTVLTPVNGTYEFNMPAGEAVLKAEFTANDYTISLKPNVQNGTLRADKLTAKYGEKVTLTLTPDNNYILKYVVVVGEKGADLTKVDDTHYSFNMPAEDVTVNCEYITFEKVEAVAPTCTEDGHIAYYLGSDGLFYADTNGTLVEDINNDRIINQADIVVKATGHSYVVDSSVWAEVNDHYYVTVYAKCSVCGKVDSIGYANVSYDDYEITKEATADETGIKTYTATVDYMGEEFTVTKNVEIPKIQAVASVNGTAYDSLKDAIKAADDGDVVILGDDVNESGLYLGDYYKPVTLDLNHHTVVLGSLNIEDNLTIKNGTLTCYISNSNVGNDDTLTLDAATINAPNGLQWLATNIAVTNGSKLNLSENVYCGGGSEDGFSLTIDDTSSVVLNNTVPSGYNEELVRSEFGKYLPDGYSFVYNETKYEYEIVDANGKVVTDPIQIPAPSYHISVTDGKLSTGKTSGDIQVSKLVTVKAGTVAGKTFSHWERNGKKVSTNATYSFYMPSEDVTLTAVFNETAADPAGTAIIESVKAASNKLSFVSVLNIPKNCKYVKGGLVATTDATIGENVSADSAQFVKLSTKATANSKNVKYTWTKSVSGETVVYVRAYLVYKDSNGKEQTVYSACVMADKNGEIRVK